MSVPETSLEFVDGVGVSAKSVHGKTFHPDQFFGVVALVTNMLFGVLGFPLQPVDGHTVIASWSLSLQSIFFLPSDEMAGRHPLHNTPKIQSIGVYTLNQLTGLWICVLGRSYEGLVFLVITMKHDARALNDAVLVQIVQIFILLIRYLLNTANRTPPSHWYHLP